ncbi:LEM domain containing protein [Trichuris trichiura]|uniref:LEM domain containing protein n=1 Tax=Trichuris trichiura TaxID=36087 RepID=A0A077ZCU8_TRITR|nr:LEM domain containing protein [Trichuris trichiura]
MVSEYGGNNEPSLDRDSNEIMSDRKIRRNLRRLGIPQGPLTRSTRRLAMSVPASTNLLLLKTADNSSDYEDSLETINPCDNTRKISKLGRGYHSANNSYAMKAWGNLKRKLGDIFHLNSPKPRSIYNGRRCGQKWRLAGWWPTLLSILGILVAVSVPCIPHLKRDRITLLPAVLYGAFCDTFNGVVHSKMLTFVFCAFMAVIIVRMYEGRRIRARAYAQRVQVREMREKIIQYMKTLKAIAIKLGLKDAFAPVDDVHDILIPFWQREATTVVWEKAVRYIGCHEKECHIQTKYVSLFGRGIAIWLYTEAADSNQEKEEEEWKDSIF